MPDDPTTVPDLVHLDPNAATLVTETGMIIYRTTDHEYVELDDIGAAFWTALETEHRRGSAVRRLVEEFEADHDQIRNDLDAFVDHLTGLGLASTDPDVFRSPEPGPEDLARRARDRYLDLVERHLLGALAGTTSTRTVLLGEPVRADYLGPSLMTLIGAPRLRNVRQLAEQVLADGTPGDFMECGVWRGGASMMMRAVLLAHEVTDRSVWLADTFTGLPEPDLDRYPVDEMWSEVAGAIAVSREEVATNFRRMGLLDHQVRFVEGLFRDTLPEAEVDGLALLRLDADLYESTIDTLTNLYDRVSPGGFVIVDDYALDSCRDAVDDFRTERGIDAAIHHTDWTGIYWQVPRP